MTHSEVGERWLPRSTRQLWVGIGVVLVLEWVVLALMVLWSLNGDGRAWALLTFLFGGVLVVGSTMALIPLGREAAESIRIGKWPVPPNREETDGRDELWLFALVFGVWYGLVWALLALPGEDDRSWGLLWFLALPALVVAVDRFRVDCRR